MKNRLSDLNNHLFAQIERLSDEGISAEDLEREYKRAEAIVAVSDQIVQNANLQIRAAEIVNRYGINPEPYLETIHEPAHPSLSAPKPNGTTTRQ